MNEARAKVLRLLSAGMEPEDVVDIIIDVVARAIQRRGGRPSQNGPTRPADQDVATPTEAGEVKVSVGQNSKFEFANHSANPVQTPNLDKSVSDLNSGSSLRTQKESGSSGDRRFNEPLPQGFAEWYAPYPRHEGKAAAIKAWKAAEARKILPPLAELIAATAWQIALWEEQGRTYDKKPLPATFLNGRLWENERPAAPVGNGTPAPRRLIQLPKGLV